MMFKGGTSDKSGISGHLDTGSHVKGELCFEGEFVIQGRLTGSIVSKGILSIGELGEVEGEIDVLEAHVSGTVRGTLHASRRVEITTTGKVVADIYAPALVIEEGAFFEGRCFMSAESRSRAEGERQKVTRIPLAKDRGSG